MKKTMCLLLSVLLAVLLLGCGSLETAPEPVEPEETETVQPEEELTPAPEEEPEEPEEPEAPEEPEPYVFGETVELPELEGLSEEETIQQAVALTETACVVYTVQAGSDADSDMGLSGQVYFYDRESGDLTLLYDAKEEIHLPYSPWLPVLTGSDVLFGWNRVYMTGADTSLWTLKDGAPVLVSDSIGMLFCEGDGQFTAIVSAYDLCEMEGFPTTGHTWKPYWFYWDADAHTLREYGGRAVTEQNLEDLEQADKTVQAYISELRQKGYELGDMYLRGNGILNVNYRLRSGDAVTNENATFQYTDGVFVPGRGADCVGAGDPGGVYLAASYPEIADDTLPETMEALLVEKKDQYTAYAERLLDTVQLWDYALCDLDHDGVLELLARHGNSEADVKYTVYTYDGRQAVECGDLRADHCVLLYQEGEVWSAHGQMGVETIYRITLEDGKAVQTLLSQQEVPISEEGPMYFSSTCSADERVPVCDCFSGLDLTLLQTTLQP